MSASKNAPVPGEGSLLPAQNPSVYAALCEKINLSPVSSLDLFQDGDALSEASLDERFTAAVGVFLGLLKEASKPVARLDRSLLDSHIAALDEQRQPLQSVLDNLQRILNGRAGALSHLADYGLPDMSEVLQGLPASAHGLVDTLSATLLKYEPRLARLEVELLPQRQPGHLAYGVRVWLTGGGEGTFTTYLGPEGRVVVG